jgi:hypothetical protein
MGSAKSRELAARRQTSVDDFVVAKASKDPTDQQISIQADNPDFTAESTEISLRPFDGTFGLGSEGLA